MSKKKLRKTLKSFPPNPHFDEEIGKSADWPMDKPMIAAASLLVPKRDIKQ